MSIVHDLPKSPCESSRTQNMKLGKYQPGEARPIPRTKQDLDDPNPQTWDHLIAYGILLAPYRRMGDEWKVYDFTHCSVDSLENISYMTKPLTSLTGKMDLSNCRIQSRTKTPQLRLRPHTHPPTGRQQPRPVVSGGGCGQGRQGEKNPETYIQEAYHLHCTPGSG